MDLLEFYKETLISLNLIVDDEGYVKVVSGDSERLLRIDGNPMVIPTADQVKHMLEPDENGTLVPCKALYNPLREDVIQGESKSLKKLKSIIEMELGHSLAATTELLLMLGASKDLQKKSSLNLNTFITTLGEAKGQNSKHEAVDEGTITRWGKVYANTLNKPGKGLISLYLKRGGVASGIKYNRLAIMSFPAYEQILESNRTTPLYGVKMRSKDSKVFALIYKYIFAGIDEPENFMMGSNDSLAPGFISLYKMFIHIASALNNLLNELSFIDEETAKNGMINITLSEVDIDGASKYKISAESIPSDFDVRKNKKSLIPQTAQPQAETSVANSGNLARNILAGAPNRRIPLQQQRQPVYAEPQPERRPLDTSHQSTAKAILAEEAKYTPQGYGGYQQQNGIYSAQPRPRGINSVQQRPQGYQSVYPQQQQQAVNYNRQPPVNSGYVSIYDR